MYGIVASSGKSSYGVKHFVLDVVEDMSKIVNKQDCKMGSTAYIIATSETYMLNSSGQWVLQKSNSGGGTVPPDPEGNTIIYDGGVMV